MKISIPKEWYEILLKISKDRKVKFNDLVIQIYNSSECLNLQYVEPTKYKNINVECECKDLIKHLKYYLFCLHE
ncbi:putative DNA-binding ribbon-helix-helix protein [Sulfurisphaera ohwakuensis]|uniref:Putative DNA-binding ribbon-helix-helix protein n=1 Tax=Sulfurisphaera ohwakuensis TaxID=69656 RepID=A0A7J9RSJ6_SULOH|nr:putative DNA-binding ribbon-helix-helix protein [Sulfurisphaera ohwakuensis]